MTGVSVGIVAATGSKSSSMSHTGSWSGQVVGVVCSFVSCLVMFARGKIWFRALSHQDSTSPPLFFVIAFDGTWSPGCRSGRRRAS